MQKILDSIELNLVNSNQLSVISINLKKCVTQTSYTAFQKHKIIYFYLL